MQAVDYCFFIVYNKTVYMAKEYKYICNIGSSSVSLTGIFIDKGNCGRFFYKEYRHDGLNKNFFKNPEKLVAIIEKLVAECSDKANREIKDVFVILPQRFFRFSNGSRSIEIKNGIVSEFDVTELIDEAQDEIEDCMYLECSPIAFRVQEDYIDDPVGQEGDVLEMLYVSVGILVRIKEFFDDVAKRLDIGFTLLPVLDPILSKLKREYETNVSSRIVLNFTDNFVDVCYCEMGAVISMTTVEVGNDDFVEVLQKVNKIDKDVAEELFRHVNLNIVLGEDEDDKYVVGIGKGKEYSIRQNNTNLKKIADYLAVAVNDAIESLVGNAVLPVFITGTDICSVRGMEKILAERITSSVCTLKPDFLVWTDTSEYAIVGLIESLCE